MAKLIGKIALVSGSGRGIGRAIALKLAQDGADVVVNDIDPVPSAEVVAEIRALGRRAESVDGDVTAPDFGERFVGAGLALGGLDIIVNNAGFTWDALIARSTDEQFQAMLDVHVVAPYRILRAAAGPFRDLVKADQEAGREVFRKVVNVSSIVGLGGNAGQVSYSSAKAAIVGMTKTLSREWGRYKVNVNAVAYGGIETRMAQAVTGEKPKFKVGEREIEMGIPANIHAAATAMIPLGRWGTPEEAAGAAWLFCVPESDFVSGQVLTVAGGM